MKWVKASLKNPRGWHQRFRSSRYVSQCKYSMIFFGRSLSTLVLYFRSQVFKQSISFQIFYNKGAPSCFIIWNFMVHSHNPIVARLTLEIDHQVTSRQMLGMVIICFLISQAYRRFVNIALVLESQKFVIQMAFAHDQIQEVFKIFFPQTSTFL